MFDWSRIVIEWNRSMTGRTDHHSNPTICAGTSLAQACFRRSAWISTNNKPDAQTFSQKHEANIAVHLRHTPRYASPTSTSNRDEIPMTSPGCGLNSHLHTTPTSLFRFVKCDRFGWRGNMKRIAIQREYSPTSYRLNKIAFDLREHDSRPFNERAIKSYLGDTSRQGTWYHLTKRFTHPKPCIRVT